MDEPTDHLKSLSLPSLLARLSSQIGELVTAEIELAKRDVERKVRGLGVTLAYAAIAVTFGLLALVALTITAIVAIATVLPDWEAAALVSAVLVGATAMFAVAARARMHAVVPSSAEHVSNSKKEDLEWAKTRVASSNK